MIRKICILLSVLWMAVIFSFSAGTGTESTAVSNHTGKVIGSLIIPGFDSWGAEEQQTYAEKIDHAVRKTAHVLEYALLAILLTGAMPEKMKSSIRVLASWAAATGYAATDELHQLLVPGRSGQFTDVLRDSGGALIGALAAFSAVMFIRKIKLKRH